jgi:spermidine/putrescine transport system substrate-binding protein
MLVCVTATALVCAGCGNMPGSAANNASGDEATGGEINVYNWGEYISVGEDDTMDVIAEFESRTGINVNYTTYDTNEQLYNQLANSNSSYDVIIPSDYMIAKLIEEGYLAELNFDNIPNYKNIMDDYKNLSFDPDNKFSVPYSWGVTALVYNKTLFNGEVKGWDALWSEENSGNILMFDNSRDAMAIAMQHAGLDVSNMTTESIDAAAKELKNQKPLLKAYVMDKVFNEMEGGQAAIAPYYAGDIATMMDNNEDLDYCLPQEGGNHFVDSMCIPKNSKNKALAEKFINFMLEPDVALANVEYICYGTPNQGALDLMDDEMKNNELINPPKEYLDKCYSFGNISQDLYQYLEEKFVKAKV